MQAFLRHAQPDDELIFTPELLRADISCARKFPSASGEHAVETDRYAQALLHRDLARACSTDAVRRSS
jgi:hypothetical protein